MAKCPDLFTLERFFDSKLTPEESTSIEAHVDGCSECSDLLVQLREDAAMCASIRRTLPPASAPHRPEIPGIVVDEEIGRGGQGVVWKGTQEATGRTVAVKMLSSTSFTLPIHRTRFLREVEIAASLRHPNIVAVFDGGTSAAGELYLVMEWVDGERIDTWARKDGRSLDEVVLAFRKVAEGVRHAHRHGVLHRDLKPGNIILGKDGSPRVLDFGLAKRLGDLDETAATRTGEFVGTVQYAAPEQLDRKRPSDDVDLLTDIHALGAILYAMLTGRPPYFVEGNLHATIQAVVGDEPPRASRLRSGVDRDLDAVIVKMLAKRREDRYASVDEMLDDLDRRKNGEVLRARRGETRHVVMRTIRRFWLPFAIAALIVVVLAVATAVSWTYWKEAEASRATAAKALERRDTQATRAEDVVASFKKALRSVSPYVSRLDYTMTEFADVWSKSLDDEKSKLPETEFTMRVALAELFRALDRPEDSERAVRRALVVAESARDVDPGEKINAEVVLIEALYAQRKTAEWRGRFATVAERATGIVQPRTTTAIDLSVFGVLDDLAGGNAERALEKTRAILDDLRDDPNFAHGQIVRVMSLELMLTSSMGRLEESVDSAKKIIEFLKPRTGLRDPESVHTLVTLADIYRLLRRLPEAESTIEKALKIARTIMRSTQTSLIHALITYAMILVDMGDVDKAGEILEEFPKADAAQRYPDAVRAAFAYRVVAVAKIRADSPQEAALAAEQGARRLDDAPNAPLSEILEAYRFWTQELAAQSRPSDAYRAWQAGVARLEKVKPLPIAEIVDARLAAAECAFRADMITESIALFRAVLAAAPGDSAPSLRVSRAAVLERLADALDEDDQIQEAKKTREESVRLRSLEKR